MPCKRPAAYIASVREKAAGIKWERELSEMEVDAGTPEGERTSAETTRLSSPEYVPEASSLAILVWTTALTISAIAAQPVRMGK